MNFIKLLVKMLPFRVSGSYFYEFYNVFIILHLFSNVILSTRLAADQAAPVFP